MTTCTKMQSKENIKKCRSFFLHVFFLNSFAFLFQLYKIINSIPADSIYETFESKDCIILPLELKTINSVFIDYNKKETIDILKNTQTKGTMYVIRFL